MSHRTGRVRTGRGFALGGSLTCVTCLTLLLGACSSVPEPAHCSASATRIPINRPANGITPQLSELGGSDVPTPC